MEQESCVKGKIDTEYLHVMEPIDPASACPCHQGSKLELYCETCGTVICFKCTIKTHNGHKYNLMSELPPSKRNLAFLLRPVEGKAVSVEKALMTLDAREEEITELKLRLQAEIENVSHEIHKALDTRKSELTDDIRDKTHLKLKTLAGERDAKETVHAQLSSSAIRIKDCLAMSDVDMLRVKKALVRKAKSVNSHFETCPDMLEVKTKEDISFSRPENFAKECAGYGQIFTPTSLDPQKFEVRGRGLETAEVGKESVVVLTARDHGGDIYNEPADSLDCKLVFEETKEIEKCMVQNRGNGLYEITYEPTKRGTYLLHIVRDLGLRTGLSMLSIIARINIY